LIPILSYLWLGRLSSLMNSDEKRCTANRAGSELHEWLPTASDADRNSGFENANLMMVPNYPSSAQDRDAPLAMT
jgi:hypothetical protein